MGPVLEAVDAGHIEHEARCTVCKSAWPCAKMRDARKEQVHYAEDLRLQKLISVEARRTYI